MILEEQVERRGGEGISVVLPAFNEVENIQPMVLETERVLRDLGRPWEIVVVDDGSRDGTARRVAELASRYPWLVLVKHATNRGYGAALRSGFMKARHDLVFFTDSDRQFEIVDLKVLLDQVEGHHMVAGFRAPRRDPWHRCFLGWVWTRSMDRLHGIGLRDLNCAFKLIRKDALCSLELRSSGAFINAEIVGGLRARGLRIAECPVRHRERPRGRQSGARLGVIVEALWEAARYGRLYSSSVSAGPRISSSRAASLAKTSR